MFNKEQAKLVLQDKLNDAFNRLLDQITENVGGYKISYYTAKGHLALGYLENPTDEKAEIIAEEYDGEITNTTELHQAAGGLATYHKERMKAMMLLAIGNEKNVKQIQAMIAVMETGEDAQTIDSRINDFEAERYAVINQLLGND